MNIVFRCLLTLGLMCSSLSSFSEAILTEAKAAKLVPSHHINGKFRNPYLPADFQPSTIAFLKARFFDDMQWPDEPENYREYWQAADLEKIHNPDFNKAQATLIGHSTVLLQYQGINILTDPVFSERPSFSQYIGPKRYTPPALKIDQLPNIDIIVISHNHYDHLDVDSVKALTSTSFVKNTNGAQPLWLVPLGLKKWFAQFEITNIKEMDWWQKIKLGDLTVQAQPSQHWSRRSIFDTNESLWASWAFIWPESETTEKFTAWFGGDTAYNPYQFKEIGETLGEIDLAMIPIGAYEPRWFMKTQHVNPLDAVEIFKDINAKSAFGIHWNTFVLTAEAVDEPPKALERALQKNGINAELFQAMDIGKTWAN
ncbi:MAG: MBL fold metallo-hydrolase [Oleispira sp.]|nr:MBL fold metallo-hydrolase [Oleispira sp.]